MVRFHLVFVLIIYSGSVNDQAVFLQSQTVPAFFFFVIRSDTDPFFNAGTVMSRLWLCCVVFYL